MSLKTIVNEDRRLVILRLLADDPDYSLNEYILRRALKAYAHRVSQDELHTDLAWLAEQNLLTVETVGSMQVAKLLTRGLDVAEGNTIVPGVARPMPGE